ncbi:HD domain-containing phosphohydrolase [Glaciecola petra]|uniref:HD domain-containing phosphohydrolase n=1 Tax=Glaciecola petra TaxID=3075602 RepID=A0ABU2ZUD2_9ALTE|nr:HD domain-containing phosphohydrolase [Aestuariibacter sp. P117]MDT0596015.1 HD domain-containing phosphohydrolase [Aestuariibacter sp. P117]
MTVFTPEEVDEDILGDLKEEIVELHEASEQTLIELELTPQDKDLQRALFRSIHTIKGDLGLVGFLPMVGVLQHLEDILDLMRKGELSYTSQLSDLVLKLMDIVSKFVGDCINSGKAEFDGNAIENTIEVIESVSASNKSEHEALLEKAVYALTNQVWVAAQDQHDRIPKTGVPKDISTELQPDVLFFRELMRPIEKRIGYPEGRGDQVAALALFINRLSEEPVAEEQLAVACYAHDFGMAFMPRDIINKKTKLDKMEENLLRSHVYKSTRLIEHLNAWDGARKIIMQHHEYIDGSGFPLGIKSEDICEGAKLLAIIDRYVSLIQPSNEQIALSEVDAVIYLNKEYKGKLSGSWLRLFNKGMTTHLKTQH